MKLSPLAQSITALRLVALVMLALFLVMGRWHRAKVVDQDVISYYSYLPAAVIHQDMTMEYAVGDDFYADKVWGVIWKENSGPVQKYTMGLSWLYAPFFLMGHLSAKVLGYPADGYSTPYMFWLQLSGVAYLLLGLAWLRKVLLRHFSESVTARTLLLLAFGTNLTFYTLGQAAMPHVYVFALVSGLMWLSVRFHETGGWRLGLALGLVASLATLVRPNHLLLWLLPVCYGISGLAGLHDRLAFWKKHWYWLLIWPLMQAVVVLPQLFYWHLLTDRWVYYSYVDESFFWAAPLLGKVLFSFRNGWLVYTPLMVLALAGLPLLRRHARAWAGTAWVVLLLGSYIISCWWCWWYGGSFGMRVFIDFYPLLALGIGAVLTWLGGKAWGRGMRVAGWAALGFFVVLNLFQSLQYKNGAIHHDAMTARAYVRSFGSFYRPDGFDAYLQPPDYEAAKSGER